MWLGGIFFRVYLDFLPCLRRSVESLSWNSPLVGKGNFNYTWGWPRSLLQGLSRLLFAWLYPNWNCHTLAEINFEHTYWHTHAHMCTAHDKVLNPPSPSLKVGGCCCIWSQSCHRFYILQRSFPNRTFHLICLCSTF